MPALPARTEHGQKRFRFTDDRQAYLRQGQRRGGGGNGGRITNREKSKQPLPPSAEWAWWYQYYFAAERGAVGFETYRHDFAKLIWRNVSPTWNFDDATFDRTAAAFDNPDYVPIVVHNYRWRLGLAKGDPRYDGLEARLEDADRC